MTDMPDVTIYTDGGASPNPGPGGWGAVLIFGAHEKELSGGELDTTNNRMELTAAIEALRALKKPCRVTLFTDSVYLKSGITSWLANWVRSGWRTSNRKPVKNRDLWQALDEAAARHEIDWRWVKGHSGNRLNNRVDRLVGKARAQFVHDTSD